MKWLWLAGLVTACSRPVYYAPDDLLLKEDPWEAHVSGYLYAVQHRGFPKISQDEFRYLSVESRAYYITTNKAPFNRAVSNYIIYYGIRVDE